MFWRERPLWMFANESAGKTWNARFKNREAFTASDSYYYRQGMVFNKRFLAHRVVWAIYHGIWPDDQIDHINGVRDDNRIENLRIATSGENARNTAIPKNNTSGIIGVCWNKRNSKWEAKIMSNGKQIHLGYFASKDDAVAARAEAEVKYGFHENHGRDAQ